MENKSSITIKQEKTISEMIDTKNQFFDKETYIQLKDMMNNLNSSNL